MKQYRCYYCGFESDEHKDTVDHLTKSHSSCPLKYREFELNVETGRQGYRTKIYDIVPLEKDVFVTEDKRIGVYRDDRAKKVKINTPSKEGFLSNHTDTDVTEPNVEHFDLSSMLSDMEIGNQVQEDRDENVYQEKINYQNEELSEMVKYIPHVLEQLREWGHLESYKKWCKLIIEKKMPMDNIAFLLFLDTVDWFSSRYTSKMRYERSETRMFWEVGYRLFKGKFLRFMSGPRNTGHVIEQCEGRGECLPGDSKINFAVPTLKSLCRDKLEPVMPGVMEDSIERIANTIPSKFVKLGVDGKKIARGKGKLMGDINCWGFETEPTLESRLLRRYKEKHMISDLIQMVQKNEERDLEFIDETDQHELNQKLKNLIVVISNRVKDLRIMLVRLDLGIEKFINLGDCVSRHWTKSKFAPVISSLKVTKYDAESSIEEALRFINDICKIISTFNGTHHLYSSNGIVNLDEQSNFYQLKTNVSDENFRYVKQKSKKWFEIRSSAVVTGSTCNSALGLGLLKQQQAHFEKVINKREDTEQYSDKQRSNMEYGSKHEIDGVATIVGRVLPSLMPNLNFYEEGCAKVSNKDNETFLVVSPDGSFRESVDATPAMMFENKCKVNSKFTPPVFYDIPKYYIPQLLCEMYAYKCNLLLFSCWSKQSTTVFFVNFDEELWNLMWEELNHVYSSESPTRPSKFSDKSKEIRLMIDKLLKEKVSFLGEFPSCVAYQQPEDIEFDTGGPYVTVMKTQTENINDTVATDKLLGILHNTHKWLNEVYQICRTSATEILVFMANDLDRRFHMEINNAHPIAYALKGASMTIDTFAQMMDHVINKCEEKGLIVIATSSDGQWHKYAVRNSTDGPLTVYQLQKDLWKDQKAKTKSLLLKEVKNTYKVSSLHDVLIEKSANGHLVVYGHKTERPFKIYSCSVDKWRTMNSLADHNTGATNSHAVDIDSETIEIVHSSNTEFDIEQNDDFNITVCSNNVGQNALIDMHSLTFMQLMFDDVNTDATQHYNVCATQSAEYDLGQAPNETINGSEHSENQTETGSNECTIPVSRVVSEALTALSDDNSVAQRSNCSTDMETQPYLNISVADERHCDNNTIIVQDSILGGNSEQFDEIVEELLIKLRIATNRKALWKSTDVEALSLILKDKNKTQTMLQKSEIILCLDTLKVRRNATANYYRSWNKQKLVDTLFHILLDNGDTINRPSPVEVTGRRRKLNPQTLSKLAANVLNRIPKDTLVATICENKWLSYFHEWSREIPLNSDILNNTECSKWFSKPVKGRSGIPRFHFTDACHILTCLRTKLCTTGISGLNKSAWLEAAKSKETQLNIAIVQECIDKQSVAFAKRMFGEDVESYARQNGYDLEAIFIRLVRRWFEAEDEPGISALDRCMRRLELRDFLLDDVNFGSFPPKTQYVKGIPIITYESLITHIERKLQIFQFVPGKCYNARSLGTQEVEQFF